MRVGSLVSALLALFCVSVSIPTPVLAQSFSYADECATRVDNATVHVPASGDVSLPDGTPVEAGDTVAVYTDTGTCAGYGVWTDEAGVTLAAAGPATMDTAIDGFAEGEALKFEIFDVSGNRVADVDSTVRFSSCTSGDLPICREGAYESGTFHQVSGFETDSTTTLTRTVALADGWNFLSLPVQSDQSFEVLFPTCSTGFLYRPAEGYTSIGSNETLPVGTGAVVQCEADTTRVTGPPGATAIEVEAGWNLIGGVGDTVSVDGIATSPAGILQSDFFRVTSEGFQAAAELHPANGYWVDVEEAGTIDLSGGASSATVAVTDTRDSSPTGFDTDRLVLVDANGRRSTLWLKEGLTEEQREQFKLPPVPPGDMFDVRFSHGYQASALTDGRGTGSSVNEHEVQLQGVAFPVDVRLETNAESRSVRIAGGGTEQTLSEERSSAQIRHATDQFVVETSPSPRSFKLGKTRPNPLRNQAKLEYAVPEPTDVTIALYDVLGRRVARLVDGSQRAGVHQAQIEAHSLASGKYFVRMRAGSFEKTRQLTVVR